MRRKILIIDDEEDLCHFVKLNLEKTRKFEVITSTKAAEGIELARNEQPDLILLDILMPDMEGSEVAESLLAEPSTKEIPVVFLTALVSKDQVTEKSGKIGKRDFIAKPVTPQELISRIEAILEDRAIN
ncbi:MAG: response regulator [Candidatus Omnitrophota bacterium]